MKRVSLLFALLTFLAFEMNAQVRTPSASPSAKSSQTIGLTEFNLEYSRPSMKGRAIFGQGDEFLVPFGKVWRTGANAVTKLSFDTDVSINGTELEKGAYAILTVPNAETWEVKFYKHDSRSWSSYIEKDPVASVKVKSMTVKGHKLETYTMTFQGLAEPGKGSLEIHWENTLVTLSIDTQVDETVMEGVKKMLAGPTPMDYYRIGAYYHDSGKDLKQALEYVQKQTKRDDARFWQLRKESLILADLGMKEDAINVAKKSLSMAEKAGNEDYVKMNTASIAEWSKK